MPAFVWDSSFVTGLKDVDDQHFYLVGLINKFGELLIQNKLSEEKIEGVFQELYGYTRYHFLEEEEMMANEGVDPRFIAQHITIHRDFLSHLMKFHDQISMNDIDSLRAFLDFLIHWLAYHILGADQSLSEQITAIKAGQTAEHAYEVANNNVHNATETLLNALNNMFKQISERNQELSLLNKTLERKVEERTRALQEANLHLEALAITDELTDLHNRRYAMSHLTQLWDKAAQENKPLSCLMIDVDHFKEVNDQYGHAAGDKVLVELSRMLKHEIRNDDILCRLGGDEFLIICEDTDCEGAKHIALFLCDEVSKFNVTFGQGAWFGSVSIGVATNSETMNEMDDLLKQADQELYKAKEAGKGCVKSTCSC